MLLCVEGLILFIDCNIVINLIRAECCILSLNLVRPHRNTLLLTTSHPLVDRWEHALILLTIFGHMEFPAVIELLSCRLLFVSLVLINNISRCGNWRL